MGEFAEMELDALFERMLDGEEYDEDGSSISDWKTCQQCGAERLVWLEWKPGRFALAEENGQFHRCKTDVQFGAMFR